MSYTLGIYTLGCKVNQYESEAIAELAEKAGFSLRAPSEVCDVYIINTCTVTGESDRKSRQLVRRAISQNPNAVIIVTGCLTQVAPETVEAIDGVSYICGNADKTSVIDAALSLVGKDKTAPISNVKPLEGAPFEAMRIEHFPRTRAYIKIEDGCESHCAYCIIPAARGKIRSKPREEVLSELCSLARGGCREVVLTGIETASYGIDFGSYRLADLLRDADALLGGNVRIRLGSLDPSLIKRDFVERIAALPSLAPHFHLSLQSGSSRILALMKRKYNAEQAMKAMELLREYIPGVKFTTDIIVGFPGETEEDFMQTVEFVKKADFLMTHIFPYSKRKGTPAASMSGQISKEEKSRRLHLLSEIEQASRTAILQREIEKRPVRTVLFETWRDGVATGHTSDFLEVSVPSPTPLDAELKTVKLYRTDGRLLYGELENF